MRIDALGLSVGRSVALCGCVMCVRSMLMVVVVIVVWLIWNEREERRRPDDDALTNMNIKRGRGSDGTLGIILSLSLLYISISPSLSLHLPQISYFLQNTV